MTANIEPIDYGLHEAFYGKNYYRDDISKNELTDPDISSFDFEVYPDNEAINNSKNKAIKEIALFILAGILFLMGVASQVAGIACLITTSLPVLPFLIGGATLLLLASALFYYLFKGSEEPIEGM